MDYSKIYIELMERAAGRDLEGYTEKHHIVPRCMGGDDKPRNIAVLTPEEHYLAHLLLVKIYPNNVKLVHAVTIMSAPLRGKRRNNKLFGWLRRKHSKLISGENHRYYGKRGVGTPNYGNNHSAESRAKISKALSGKKHPHYGKRLPEKTMAKAIETTSKRVQQILGYNIVAEFSSISEASRVTGVVLSGISKTCSGKRKSSGGYVWRYSLPEDK